MSRFGGRFAPNLENEVRRAVREPVSVWKHEWVTPSTGGVKILKWVKTSERVEFPEDQDVQRQTADPAIIDVQPLVPEPPAPTPQLTLTGGLGSIAPIDNTPTPAPAPAPATVPATQEPTPESENTPAPAAASQVDQDTPQPQVAAQLHPPVHVPGDSERAPPADTTLQTEGLPAPEADALQPSTIEPQPIDEAQPAATGSVPTDSAPAPALAPALAPAPADQDVEMDAA